LGVGAELSVGGADFDGKLGEGYLEGQKAKEGCYEFLRHAQNNVGKCQKLKLQLSGTRIFCFEFVTK
jgi:hypothetical protein